MRTLYDCRNARYPVPPFPYIRCAKRHLLDLAPVPKWELGEKLEYLECQNCPDFDDMNDNHKGQPCIVKPNLLCQEGYCSECEVDKVK